MKKLLVYLDQSYLSSMAKETTGSTRGGHAATGVAMGQLLEVLRALVDSDRILCPSSIVQDQETGLDNRIEEPIFRIVKELSEGIGFLTYRQIELDQTLRAMRRYLGLEAEAEDDRWRHGFMRDPHQPVRRPRMHVHIRWHDLFSQDDRRRKEDIQSYRLERYSVRHQSKHSSYADCRREQILSIARLVYFEPYQKFLTKVIAAASGIDSFPAITDESSLEEVLQYVEAVTPPVAAQLFKEYSYLVAYKGPLSDKRFWEFFLSPEFDAVPYNHIFCSLNAGFLFYKPEGKPRASDPYDMAALASVLPYVDIVTTDSGMKDMLHQLGLDEKFGVSVYSSKLYDVEALTRRLSGMM